MSTKFFITWMNDRHISEKYILINTGEYFTLSFFYDQKTFQKKKKLSKANFSFSFRLQKILKKITHNQFFDHSKFE